MYDVTEVRKLFPHTRHTIYFNTASNGPLSTPAYRLQDEYYRTAQMARIGHQGEVFEALDRIRANGAKVFGCRRTEVGFGFNTTFGINLAAFGLPLKPGDEVFLSDVEFPANVYPWLELRNRGIIVRFLKSCDRIFDIDLFRRSISKKTRVLSLSFVQFFNGYKNDMAAIGQICQAHNIFFVVDAIQGAGAETMHVDKWQVDIASAGAQKWLLSSQGSGIFYISEATKKVLIPPWRSWLGVDWRHHWSNLLDFGRPFEATARQYELGTYPAPHVMSLDWALDFITKLGIADIHRHNHALLDRLIEYLTGEPFYRITSALDKKHRSSILTFTTDRADVEQVYNRLLKKDILTALREGSIRVSVHLFNNDRDLDRLIAALKQAIPRTPGKR